MKRFFLFLALLAPFAVLGATETSPDPFALAHCARLRVPPFGEDAKYVTRYLRPAYALEFPFHAVLDDVRLPVADHNAEHPDAKVTALFVGHGGYLLESPLPHELVRTEFVLIFNAWLGRAAASVPCIDLRAEPFRSRIRLDPFTGNAFVARLEETTLDVVVIDAEGAPLARIRHDLFSSASLVDLTGTPYVGLEMQEDPEAFFWFDVERLDPFVDAYRRTGGEEYARFVSDAFLADWMQSRRGGWPRGEGLRLPYLPLATHRPLEASAAARRLDGLRTSPYWEFVPGKPRKGGVLAMLVTLLKLLEARDCPREDGRLPPSGSCPSYSVMALQTEFYRAFPKLAEAEFQEWQLFDLARSRGVCHEHLYPIPEGEALGWPKTFDQFAMRSEKALNRILQRGEASGPAVAEFLESHDGRRIEFVEALPPRCAEDMRRYVEQQDLVGSDFVSLYALQHEAGRSLAGSDTETLREAQQAELVRLVLQLLDDGVPVMLGSDDDMREGHAVLAYGRTEHGIVVMDPWVEDEAARRRTVIPFADFEGTLLAIAFLRGELEESDPTEAQLRRSLEHAPDNAKTHYLLGRILQGVGRHREAVRALRRAVELDPDDRFARRELGQSLSEIGRFDEAVEAFGEAIERGLDGPYCHASQGYALRKLGRLDDAAKALQRALQLDPDRPWAARQLGWTHHAAGDDLEAEIWFRKAIDLAPDTLWHRLEFSEFLACVGRGDEARRLLLADPEALAEAWELSATGIRLLHAGYPAEASALFERAIAVDDDDEDGEVEATLSLARAYLALGDVDGAAAVLKPLEQRLSSRAGAGSLDADGWIRLAYARAVLGEQAACTESVEELLRIHGRPDSGDAYEVACIHALNGNPERALDALEQALELGFQDYHWAWHDPDLSALVEDPRFGELLDRYAPHER